MRRCGLATDFVVPYVTCSRSRRQPRLCHSENDVLVDDRSDTDYRADHDAVSASPGTGPDTGPDTGASPGRGVGRPVTQAPSPSRAGRNDAVAAPGGDLRPADDLPAVR